MKKTLIKLLSSTIALTLVLATSGAGTAQIDKIKTEDVKADNTVAVVQEVKEENKGTGIIEALEEKMKEEVPVVEVKAEPVVEVKAEPVAAPAAEVKAEEAVAPVVEVAAPEIEAVPAEEVVAPEAEPVETWNISASESDNVAMKFYAEPAADANQITVDRQHGVVQITGTGAMEENVYRHFMSVEKYLTATKAAFEAAYGVEVEQRYDYNITDVLELDANISFHDYETGEELYVTEDMCMELNPADFLEYSPSTIIIDEGITDISDCAFLCCSDLQEVVLPSTIECIGEYAFQYCGNLARIEIPEKAEIKDGAFEYCQSLEIVDLTSVASDNGIAAQSEDGSNVVRTLTAEEVADLVNGN